MKARIVKIGNSRGIRIPKALLVQSRVSGEVELEVQGNQILIRPAFRPREGWEDAFRSMARQGDDRLLDVTASSPPQWDEEEWRW
jgi:antitoxin MazE